MVMRQVDSEIAIQFLRSENAYLRGKIEAYESFLGLKGCSIEQKECGNCEEGLEDASRD